MLEMDFGNYWTCRYLIRCLASHYYVSATPLHLTKSVYIYHSSITLIHNSRLTASKNYNQLIKH